MAHRQPRREHDFYETPPHYTQALTDTVNIGGTIIEPCVGGGNISRMIRDRGIVFTNDIDEQRTATYHYDASERDFWRMISRRRGDKDGHVDWVVTNPPFSKETPILQHALAHAYNVAMLARLSFLEPTKTSRAAFWKANAQRLERVIVLPRYSFTGSGSDSMTCCWMIFSEAGDYDDPIISWSYDRGQPPPETGT